MDEQEVITVKHRITHPTATRRTAAKVWLATGSRKKAAEKAGIPLETLHSWIYLPWWKDMIEDLRRNERTKIAARLQKIALKSYEVVDERLENGDYIVGPDGKLQRKPVDAKTASRIGADALDRAHKFNPEAVDKTEQTVAQLSDLARRFEALAKKQKPIVEVTDVIVMEKENE